MNKIKVLYDVARVMREKDALGGTINIVATRDAAEAFRFTNEFNKDFVQGRTTARITTVADHGGKQVKHESTTEFILDPEQGEGRRWCRKHHGFHSIHCGIHGSGVKGKLDRLLYFLGVLNDMKIVEQEDKSLLLSIDLKDIPEDLKEGLRERITHRHPGQEYFMNGAHSIEKASLECKINNKYEVETITAWLQGKLLEENGEQVHDVVLNAAIKFAG